MAGGLFPPPSGGVLPPLGRMDYEQRVKGHVCIAFHERILRFSVIPLSLFLSFVEIRCGRTRFERVADLGLSLIEAEVFHKLVDWCFFHSSLGR